MSKTFPKLLKELNEVKVLNLLRYKSPISRSKLAEKSGISKVAISKIVDRLDEDGYIVETGKGQSTSKGGKPPTLIELNPEKGYVIGIDYKSDLAHIAIANIDSEIVKEFYIDYETGTAPNKIIEMTCSKIDQELENLSIPEDKIISIGIGVPGFINYEEGVIEFAETGMNKWSNEPIASTFTERYNVPILIENDVNLITIGENLQGKGQDRDNLICFYIGNGIGSGIIVDDQLIRGVSGSAGEIGFLEPGYIIKDKSKVKNLYSNQTYFGDILSERHLLQILKMKLKWENDSNNEYKDYSLKEILELGDQGNSTVQSILDEYSILIAHLCSEMIKTLNINNIILCGEALENSSYLINKIRYFITNNMHNIPFEVNQIESGSLGDSASVRGAISLALQVIFKPSLERSNINQMHL